MPFPNPYDEQNSAAWWVAGIVGFGVFVWKAVFNLRRDTRDDKEGRTRQDLIDQLQEEILAKIAYTTTLEEAYNKLSKELDEEIERRRAAETRCYKCEQRERKLLHRIKDLGGAREDDYNDDKPDKS